MPRDRPGITTSGGTRLEHEHAHDGQPLDREPAQRIPFESPSEQVRFAR